MQRSARMFLIALLPACAPSVAGSGDDSTSTGTSTGLTSTTGELPGTSSGASPTTGSAESTTMLEPSTGENTTSSTTAGETTTSSTTTSDVETTSTTGTTSDTSDTSDTETTAAAELVTQAWWVPGNQLTIRVIQHDPGAGLCRGIIIESLMNGGGGGMAYIPVETPPEWLVHYAFVHQKLDDCFDPYDWWLNDWVAPDSATGSVVFNDLDAEGRPATVDIDFRAVFEPGEAWVPATDDLLAIAVPVMNG